MAIPHTMEEEGGNNNAAGHGGNEDLDLPVAVPEDVQAVMIAAEDGDAPSLSTALGSSHFLLRLGILYHALFNLSPLPMRSCLLITICSSLDQFQMRKLLQFSWITAAFRLLQRFWIT